MRNPAARLLERAPAGPAASPVALYLLGLLAAVKAAGLVLVAEAVARGIGGLAGTGLQLPAVLWLGAAGVVLRAGAAWAQQVTAQRLAQGVKEELRHAALRRLLADGGVPAAAGGREGVGSVGVLLTRGLDGLDKYYVQYLPALVTCAVVPLLVGLRILAADWVSAVVVLVTVPLVPLFMVLIGWHTQDRTREAAGALGRMSDHLLELAKGLPVLVGLGRAAAQTRALKDIADTYAARTLATLRVAFLSSLALELISTISVAVVAVFIGVRLVHGDLGLETGLLVLILAPECYLPLREVGAAHHASDDGAEAGRRVRALLDAPRRRTPPGDGAGRTVSVQGLSARYKGARTAVFEGVGFTLEPGSITALRGPSGCGKSTLMNLLAGAAGPNALLEVSGEVHGLPPGSIAWVPQHPQLLLDTVEEELALYAGLPAGHAALADGLSAVGGLNLLHRSTGELSPGELRRVAVARALLRVRHSGEVRLLLLDEPTAHVDARVSAAIGDAVRATRGHVTVLLIAHDDATAAIADRWIRFDGRESAAVGPGSAAVGVAAVELPRRAAPDSGVDVPASRTVLRALRLARPWSPRFLAALGFGVGSSLFAVALAALSAWLIVRASAQPPILYLLGAIVGVRFFGIGRSLLRYCERLWLHDAVFQTSNEVRIRLWQGLMNRAESWRSLSRGSGAIERLVGDVDELRDVSARAVFPPLTALLTGAAAVLATWIVLPGAIGWQLAAVVLGGIAAPLTAVRAERAAGAAGLRLRAASLSRTTRLLTSARELQVNDLADAALERISRIDDRASAGLRRTAWAAGAAQAVIILACGVSALGVLWVSGGAAAESVAVVVLMQLALIEPFTAGAAAVQQWGPLGAVTSRIQPELAPRNRPEQHTAGSAQRIGGLLLDGVSVGYGPGRNVVDNVFLPLAPGHWTALTGPSGSGKSTVVGAVLGFLPVSSGRYLINGASVEPGSPLLRRIAWCPQESHLFNSTIRANLQLARPAGAAAPEEELLRVLAAVGLEGLAADLEDGLDTRIGPSGDRLSGGQRQRLAVARALLTEADVVVLDEPTAQLDADGAATLLADLRAGLTDKAVLLVTHNEAEARACGTVVQLGEHGSARDLRWEHAYAGSE